MWREQWRAYPLPSPFFFKRKTAYEILACLEFRRVLFRSDIGSSTGGFTDVLLQAGAAKVHAVDCGAGQLDWKLRTDPRVVMHEGLNARSLTFQDIGEPVDFLCCDVSFISVTLILPAVTRLLQPGGQMVILIKPQFEVGKGQVGKGGIVRQ